MKGNKMKEVKNKVVGSVEEKVGQMTDDKQLEMKGKMKQGVGKAYEIMDDYVHEVEDLKDTVVGTAKEKTGQLTDDKTLELKGKLQRSQGIDEFPNKLIFTLGIVAVILLIIGLIGDDE